MFIFTTETIFKIFEVLMPEHAEVFSKIKTIASRNLSSVELSNAVKFLFEEFEKFSIDFGIMEFLKNIKVIPVNFGWNDIGSFTALSEIFRGNSAGNIIRDTKTILHDAKDNIIICDNEKTSDVDYEIILVDNDSKDGSHEYFSNLKLDNFKYIQSGSNLGFGKANNLGYKIAKGNKIFLLNTDTLLINNAINILYDEISKDSEIGVVGGNLYDIDMKPAHSFF
ncbi:MAG: glycosyltransferase [Cetobacterium sp.]